MPGIHIDLTATLWIVILLTILAFLAAAILYRRTRPPVSPVRRWILIGLRGCSLALLVLLLFDPILHFQFTTSTPPVLALLLDNSKSLRIVDRSGNRATEIASVRNAPVLDRIGAKATILSYTFGVRLRPFEGHRDDSLQLDEGGTDIGSAMQSIADLREGQRMSAILLVSDGTYTLGQDPVNKADRFDIPLYCIGIGDTAEQKDVLISNIAANDLAYAGTQSPVRATIMSSGFDSNSVEVTLSDGGRVLDRKSLRLHPGSNEYAVDLSYAPEGEGMKRYVVDITTLPGEVSTANNRRSFSARVLKSKLRVLIIAGEPSPDMSTIRQTLTENKNFTVRSFTQTTSGSFYEGRFGPAEFDSIDCFVFVGFPTSATSPEIGRLIARRVATSSTPILFIDGKHANVSSISDIAQALPFTVSIHTGTEQAVSFQPSDTQRENPILDGERLWTAWNDLPPVYRTLSTYTVKPGGVVLGTVRSGGATAREPLLLARSASQEKTIALLAYGVWRWRLMTQESAPTADLLAAFLDNAIKWLTTPDDRRPVRVSPVNDSFPEGQAVEFTGQAYDQNSQPEENASIHVTAEANGHRYDADLRPIGGGRYEGSMEGLTEGEYTFRATGSVNGSVLGEDRGRFVVGGTELEFQDTRANHLLLRQLAFRTGGAYLEPSSIDRLDSLLFSHPSFTQQSIVHTTDASLRHMMWMIIGLVVLFAAEWILRKQSGML